MAGEGFPWRAIMAFGLGHLKLSSRDFWATTPRELIAAAEALTGMPAIPMGRDELSRLTDRYPDGKDDHG